MDKNDASKSLSLLSDDELLLRLSEVLKQSRRVESDLVAHIAEVDARRLYLRQASSSMFKYATDVLHLSEAEAYLRIAAARASRRYPALLTMLEDGRIHLSGISVLAPHLDVLSEEKREELLVRATHKTKRETQVLVAEIAPKPDVPPSIRKVPERGKEKTERPSSEAREEASSEKEAPRERQSTPPGKSSSAPASEPPHENDEKRDPREQVEPLSAATYKVQFTASADFPEWIQRLAALTPGADLATMIETSVKEHVERLEAKRYGKVKSPRKSLEDADTSPGVRGVTAPVKRFAWERDRAQCAFVSEDGRRCPERHGLEFDHVEAFGLGGDRSAPNIRLLCKAHNQYMAEKVHGKKKMDQYRRSGDRVREPSPSFDPLLPDGAIDAPPVRATATHRTMVTEVGAVASAVT